MSTIHTPKSLLIVSFGVGIALILIIVPVWFGNSKDVVKVVEEQNAPHPSLLLTEEQKKPANNPPEIELSTQTKSSKTDVPVIDVKQEPNNPEPSVSKSHNQSTDNNVEIKDIQDASTVISTVPTIDEKAQHVENVGRLTENLQNRAGLFIGKNQTRIASKLSLEDKTAKVNKVDSLTQKTITRIEVFLNNRP